MFRAPCAHLQEVKIVLYSLWYHHTYRWPSRAHLNINELDALNFIMSLFHASTCFEHMCLSSGDQNCTYSLWYHHTYRWPSRAHLNINQVDALNFIMSLFHASTCFEHHVLIVRRAKLYYTASGIITPIGGRPVHTLILTNLMHWIL